MNYKRVVIIGYGKIALQCLKFIKDNFNGLIDVVKLEKEFIVNPIEENNVNYVHLKNKGEVTEFFKEYHDKTLIVSANNNYLFPKDIVNKQNLFIVNFHSALLPNYKGRNAQTWAIFEQIKKTGITWHVVNEKVDDGNILVQEEYLLKGNEKAIFLTKKLMDLGIKSFKEIFPDLIKGNLVLKNKKKETNNKMYYSSEIPNNGVLNLSTNIQGMFAFLRSVDYGIAKIFPNPKLFIQNKEREIKKYKLFQIEVPEIFSIRIIDENTVQITESNTTLILYLY